MKLYLTLRVLKKLHVEFHNITVAYIPTYLVAWAFYSLLDQPTGSVGIIYILLLATLPSNL